MKITVTAAEFASLLDRAPPNLRYLSLDCFDTLLWRIGQAPQDVFADLPIEGGGVWPRMRAEQRARRAAQFEGRHEVTIDEIYRHFSPDADASDIAAAIDRELVAEARHCFAFAPTVALIREAKRRGLEVIIVSDTYLAEPQLRALIAAAAGDDVVADIDRIFCSSEYGVAKAGGLFEHVLAALKADPRTILHAGDKQVADQKAPSDFGICTAHLRQFDGGCDRRLRLEAAAGALIDPATRTSLPACQPHRAQLSLRSEEDAAFVLGHDVLGPMLHAFAGWVRDEAAAMSERLGRPTKLLFLLRDGHLPKQVFEAAFGGDERVHAVEVSRFTARRASFTDAEAIQNYLSAQSEHGRSEILADQLLLSPAEGQRLSGGRRGLAGQQTFARGVLDRRFVDRIVARSAAFADRLGSHLARVAGVVPGDAVMLVDLGYNGTVQNVVEPVLRDRFGLEVAGRYLLLREEAQSGLDKKGYFDSRHYDNRVLHAMTGPIAVIEQMCTIAQGSVIDYAEDGAPIRKAVGVKGGQSETRDRIQQGCVAFSAAAGEGVHRPAGCDDADARRRMAAAILARLLFMPAGEEVAIFERFDHDVNLGTTDMVPMLDSGASASGLRRRGLSYLNDAHRIYLPGEIQPHGLPLNLALFSVHRFGLELRGSDFQVAGVKIPVFLADARGQTAIEVEAHPTHDGFYLATIPIGAGRFAAGIQIGGVAEWLQIEEAGFYPVENFLSKGNTDRKAMIPAQMLHEGMTEEAPGLYRCAPGALMLAPPPATRGDAALTLTIVFRPLVWRQANELRKAA